MLEIIINPNGASGRTMSIVEDIQKFLGDMSYQIHYSSKDVDIRTIVEQLTSNHQKNDIIVVGGDGSMNEAINGIQDFENTRFGFISFGSGNDLARSLNFSDNISENIKLILDGKTKRTIDIGEIVYHKRSNIVKDEKSSEDQFVHHRFAISSGIGFDAQICYQSQDSKIKKFLNRLHLGKLIYLITALKLIMSHKIAEMDIEIDDTRYQFSNVLFTVCMNEPYEGGGFKFCPNADDKDGLLDVCIADSLTRRKIMQVLPYAYSGGHIKFKEIHSLRGKKVHIQSSRPLWVHTDGEVACQSDDITLSIHENKLQLLQ